MAEAYARKIETIDDLNAFMNRTAVEVSVLVQQAGNPCYYKTFPFSTEAQWKFTPPRWPLANFPTEIATGFVGEIWRPADHMTLPVFTDWEELAKLLGNMIAIGERMPAS